MSIALVLRRATDRLMGGRGESSITVPVMDGALKPNDRLERARSVAMVEEVDNLVAHAGSLLCSSGTRVLTLLADGATETIVEAEGTVSCLASDGQGALAIGIDGTGIHIHGGRHDGALLDRAGTSALLCPTAATFLDCNRLVVTNGSARFTASQWCHDLMERGQSGSVLLFDMEKGQSRVLASDLAFPSGLCADGAQPGALLVAEAWRHRILRIGTQDGGVEEALTGLPAYPGRMAQARAGGYWLACFAPRSQLQEFVLRENRYRRQMIAEVEPDFWIAPALSSGRSFREPLQAGGVIRLGVHKPWAPTRSYGLVVRLDAHVQPVWSLHSRANGSRHGVTSVADTDLGLVAASKGKGEVVAFDHASLDEPNDFTSPGEAP